MSDDTLDTFWKLVKDVHTCMMTTRDGNHLRARPMAPLFDETTHEIRFLTQLSSHKTDELASNPDCNLAFANPSKGDYVSVSGQAYLTQDRKLIDLLWKDDFKAWFKNGKDDPDVGVIRVVPAQAEYWDSNGALKQAWEVFKAKHSDTQPDMGENKKLSP
ncbi:General stress protein 26 [Faunimonas pinastri]|uniref:General stress protein 26 n=1 Tax=Faunimonas pinastri TaxID=1855383 RepID=A0A1H9FDI5_9HYPH|nr:pyridoxamine 5'-phosphate oxidase family protein [Faunimonas pinastri]SEQ35967.1 General stress protein 26 [Faunimonas pinastri]